MYAISIGTDQLQFQKMFQQSSKIFPSVRLPQQDRDPRFRERLTALLDACHAERDIMLAVRRTHTVAFGRRRAHSRRLHEVVPSGPHPNHHVHHTHLQSASPIHAANMSALSRQTITLCYPPTANTARVAANLFRQLMEVSFRGRRWHNPDFFMLLPMMVTTVPRLRFCADGNSAIAASPAQFTRGLQKVTPTVAQVSLIAQAQEYLHDTIPNPARRGATLYFVAVLTKGQLAMEPVLSQIKAEANVQGIALEPAGKAPLATQEYRLPPGCDQPIRWDPTQTAAMLRRHLLFVLSNDPSWLRTHSQRSVAQGDDCPSGPGSPP
ncbi:hypothetical protein QBC46DRAFT_445088 [Diplogelasinospora grovesii]|uniref:Uncharacterized protein n=1 Tax=Diplogelasinospora grovesii TaxID=303347 RepID=A0AAN6NHM3_9PEZI|nr:hypothetical protein QBC46DRAFT_445088 [Diplogelasinospora grovesii]